MAATGAVFESSNMLSDDADVRAVLIHGAGTSIGLAVGREFVRRGTIVALYDAARPAQTAAIVRELSAEGGALDLSELPLDEGDVELNLAGIAERCGRLDALVNLFVPSGETGVADLQSYALKLYQRDLAAAAIIALYNNNGMIVNQFLLASSFADTELGHCVAAARGAIAGMTRTLGIRHARLGVRVTGLLVGLLDAPEIKLLASERVLASTTPLQRWAEPVDVAKCLAFLVLDSGYITGQLWVMDGGLTAGGNGF